MDTQIKSKERVSAHGEVFTNPREVNAMLDLVKAETERIDSRFLEPACGDGNFLIEILRRKLAVCEARVKAKQYTQLQYEHDAVWEGLVKMVGTIEVEDSHTLEEQIHYDEARAKLLKRIEDLEAKSRNEKQTRRRLEMFEELQDLKSQIKK